MKLLVRVFGLLAYFSSVASAQSEAFYTNGLTGTFEDPNSYLFVTNPANLTIPDNTTLLYFPSGSTGFTTIVNGTPTVIQTPGSVITFTQGASEQLQTLFVSGDATLGGTTTTSPGTVNYAISGGSTLTVAGDPTDGAIGVVADAQLNFSGGSISVQSQSIFVGEADSSETAPTTGTLTFNGTALTYDSATNNNTFQVGYGAVGTVTESASSSVTTGQSLLIGIGDTSGNNGTGTYTVSGSSLTTGTLLGTAAQTYGISLGYNEAAGENSSGTLNIQDTSSLTANAGSDIEVGGGLGSTASGTGTINQSGTSTVALESGSSMELGFAANSSGTYNLSGGTLMLTGAPLTLAQGASSAGTLNQTGGTFTTDGASTVIIGQNGVGTYNLSGGAATFGAGFTVGQNSGSSGAVVQSGTGSGSALIANGAVTIGGAAGSGTTGSYSLTQTSSSGAVTASFNAGLTIGTTGTFTQNGGTVTSTSTTVNGTYNQSGGNNNVASNQLTINGVYNLGGTLTTGGNIGLADTGTLNLTGGTLATNSTGFLIDYYSSVISATSALDTTQGDIVIVDPLSGNGGLVVTGGHTVFFDSSNTYAGGTTIAGGSTLRTNIAYLPPSGAITFATGTLDLEDTTTSAYFNNPILGTGGNLITSTTPGVTLELIAPVKIDGTTTLGPGGTLQVFNGSFGTISQSNAGNPADVFIGGASLVPGAPAVPTSGTVTIGTGTYTGGTSVAQNFTFLTGGSAGDVTNNGTVGSSLGIGNVTIAGTLTQNSGSILDVRANPFAHDDYLVNNANLSGNIAVVAQGSGTYTIVDAGAGAVTAAGLTSSDVSPLINTSLTINPNNVVLTVVQGTTLPFAQTPNQRAVSSAIDPFVVSPTPAFVPYVAALDNLTLSQIPGALQELTPQSLQYMRNITLENTTFMTQGLDGHLADLRSGYSGLDASGLSLGTPGFSSSLGRSLMAYYAPVPNEANYYPPNPDEAAHPSATTDEKTISDSPDPLTTFNSAPPAGNPRLSEFVSGDVILADLKQNGSSENAASSKATYTAGNATAGVSFRMTNNLAAGVLFDYTHTDAKTDSQGSKTRVDSYAPGIYGTFFKKGFYANGLFSYGYNQYSNSRNFSFPGISNTATSNPNGNQYVVNADFGYDFQPDNHIVIGPTLGLQYTHLDIDSFTESGAGPVDLSVDDESLDSLRSRLGAHFTYQTHIASVLLQPHVSASWQHEFLDTSYGINSQFGLPGSSSFNFQTAALGRDSALLSFGLTATFDDSLSAYLNYLAEVGEYDYFVQSIQGGIKAQF